MLSLASKLYFGITAFALIAAAGYGVAVGERAGLTVLLAAAAGAAVAGAVLIGAPDRAAVGDASAPAPVLEPARPSRWPVLTAAAVLVLATGAATGAPLVVIGVLAVVGALVAWFGQAWSEHPSWTEHHAARVSDRALLPVFLPIGVFALVAVIVVSFSRVLLATPKTASTLIALIAAVLILAGCSLVALRPNLGSSAVTALTLFAGASLVAAGVAGAVAGEREFHLATEKGHEGEGGGGHAEPGDEQGGADAETGAPGQGPLEVTISAKNVAFDTDSLTLRANADVKIVFDNSEPLPHNVAILKGGKGLFHGAVFSGPKKETYAVPKLAAGTYDFICDVHPTTMKGKLVVN